MQLLQRVGYLTILVLVSQIKLTSVLISSWFDVCRTPIQATLKYFISSFHDVYHKYTHNAAQKLPPLSKRTLNAVHGDESLDLKPGSYSAIPVFCIFYDNGSMKNPFKNTAPVYMMWL
jgi:hypothetical protein